MDSEFNALSHDRQAKVLAETAVFIGLANAAEINSDFKSWKDSAEANSFVDYLLKIRRFDEREISAIETIAERTVSNFGLTVFSFLEAPAKPQEETALPTSNWERPNTTQPVKSDVGHLNSFKNKNENRFSIVSSHRAGGLGEVYIATDTQFDRQVAVKKIKPRFTKKPEFCDRFWMEAALTGGLEHPGIVPVYGLGQSDDGTPYYAMKFIQGQSLGDAIKEFHSTPNRDLTSFEFRKLLQRFASVCYTIQFSHSRGVLHRDIKPDNIMLGDFDETLVVDWGIAKVIGGSNDSTAADDSPQSPVLLSSSPGRRKGNTQFGQVIGSAGYISAEQALGWHDSLTPRSDVFSLGATLYAMLIGSAPFSGATPADTLEDTIIGNYRTARERNNKVPGALDAICNKAMQNRRSARYTSALAMAEDIEAYLADEPILAWKEPLLVRLGRWSKKHRTAVATGLTGLLAMTVISILASVMLASANTREVVAKKRATANFTIAKSVVDDVLKKVADDPRLESGSLHDIAIELLSKAENLQAALDEQNQNDESFDIDRADTDYRIAAVAFHLGDYKKAKDRLESARELLRSHVSLDVTAKELMTRVLLDYSDVLFKMGKPKASVAVSDEALDLVESMIDAKVDLASSIFGKLNHLVQKSIVLSSLGDIQQAAITREKFWATTKQFFASPEELKADLTVPVARMVLNRVDFTEQESNEYREIRQQCIETIENSAKLAVKDDLTDLRTIAEDNSALASAYANQDMRVKSFTAGMKSADAWFQLAKKIPNDLVSRRFCIWALSTAFFTWQEHETIAFNSTAGERPQLELEKVTKIYEQAKEMFEPYSIESTDSSEEVVLVYTHLLGNLARYMELHEYAPDLVDELLEQAVEQQERFDIENNENAVLVRNEVMRTAGIHYMKTGQKQKGRDVFNRMTEGLEKKINAAPDNFVPHRQLYDLRVVRMILESPDLDNVVPSDLERTLTFGKRAIAGLKNIPVALQHSHAQQLMGMNSRLSSMQAAGYETGGMTEEFERELDEGVNRLLEQKLKMPAQGPALWVVELVKPAVINAFEKNDYQTPTAILDYLLADVYLSPNSRVFMLASRAKCHAKSGRLQLAEADIRDATKDTEKAFADHQLTLAVAALIVADSFESNSTNIDGADESIKFLDDYATELLLQKTKEGLFATDEFIRDIVGLPDRLKDRPDLKPLYEKLHDYKERNPGEF